jgi:hypothetical protein
LAIVHDFVVGLFLPIAQTFLTGKVQVRALQETVQPTNRPKVLEIAVLEKNAVQNRPQTVIFRQIERDQNVPKLFQPVKATHAADAKALIDAVRVVAGDDFAEQDAAEAGALLALAAVVDGNPANIGALRELRISLATFRQTAIRANPREQNELAELVARLSGPPAGAWQKAFDVAIAAGMDDWAAHALADAATDPTFDPAKPRIRYKRMVNGVEMDD